jgi:hypothetical protein
MPSDWISAAQVEQQRWRHCRLLRSRQAAIAVFRKDNTMKYLVTGTNGPGFSSAEQARTVLNDIIIPSFNILLQYEKDGVIQGGGLPVGGRAMVFIMEAKSNEDLDRLLRRLPVWGSLDWDVTALQSFQGRMEIEQGVLNRL